MLLLWDKQTGTIVNNESAEIIRMLNSAFDRLEDVSPLDFYPAPLRGEIDELNARIYETVNKASIAPALRLPSRLTKKRSGRCSARWTGWTGACPGGVT